MAPKNGWHRLVWLMFVSGLSLIPCHQGAAEITQITVTASSDIGPFRGKGYREVQATMEGVAPGGSYSVPIVLAFPKAVADYNGFALIDVFNTVTVGDPKWARVVAWPRWPARARGRTTSSGAETSTSGSSGTRSTDWRFLDELKRELKA
jgi:hypothetical protein